MDKIFHGKLNLDGIVITAIDVDKVTEKRIYIPHTKFTWRSFVEKSDLDPQSFEKLGVPSRYSAIEAFGEDEASLRLKLLAGLELVKSKVRESIALKEADLQSMDNLLAKITGETT